MTMLKSSWRTNWAATTNASAQPRFSMATGRPWPAAVTDTAAGGPWPSLVAPDHGARQHGDDQLSIDPQRWCGSGVRRHPNIGDPIWPAIVGATDCSLSKAVPARAHIEPARAVG